MLLNLLSDNDLWSLILKDNYRAFTVFFDRYWFKLYKTVQKYFKDESVCEEIIHDLFLNIWQRRHHLTIHNFEHYLKASARYQMYATQRKIKESLLSYREDLEENENYAEPNSGDEKIQYMELEELLNQQLEVLPNRCREIFLLSRKFQLTNTEIGEKLNISKRTVENQITIALKHLKLNFSI